MACRLRYASINDLPIKESEKNITGHLAGGRMSTRVLSELGL